MVSVVHLDQDQLCSFQTSTCHLICTPHRTLYKQLFDQMTMIILFSVCNYL